MQHTPILKLDSAETKPLLPFWHVLRSTECEVKKTDGDLGLKCLHGFCKNTNLQILCFRLAVEPSKKVAISMPISLLLLQGELTQEHAKRAHFTMLAETTVPTYFQTSQSVTPSSLNAPQDKCLQNQIPVSFNRELFESWHSVS